MFHDYAKIYVKAGDGGNGVISFRREKYVPEGGPDGGDGGRGGDVILLADEGLRTLVDFKYKRHYKAGRGHHGRGKKMHGRSGEDLVLRVPVGTLVKDADTGALLADLVRHGQREIIARGGRGGRGNARFLSNRVKVPRLAEKGEPGEEKWLQLELKLLADVGLLGLPNAGKSTFLARVSAAKPKIADYPFTTLSPNLGVVSLEEGKSFVVADIPGLIEGAHQGAGLGHDFLKHLDRTKILIHLVDLSSEERDPAEAFAVINRELNLYSRELGKKPQIIAANKMDLPVSRERLESFRQKIGESLEIFPISAVTGEGIVSLLERVNRFLEELPAQEPETDTFIRKTRYVPKEERFRIEVIDGIYFVKGREVEKHLAMTDLENEEAVRRFQKILEIMGVDDALRQAGAKTGDVVRIKDQEFEFRD
ncbi:MAG: GTPase ObgE [Bacillota bacterium]|jgi:GTP-binding protein